MKNGAFWDVTPCGCITSQKTPFFIVTAVKTSMSHITTLGSSVLSQRHSKI
jgi:hypothetical protein